MATCRINQACTLRGTHAFYAECISSGIGDFLLLAGRDKAGQGLAEGAWQADRRILGFDIGLAEFGWPIGMPLCRPLGDGLWEVRSNLTGSRIARVIFCIEDGHMILLHGFVKKTRRTPLKDIKIARGRQREVIQ